MGFKIQGRVTSFSSLATAEDPARLIVDTLRTTEGDMTKAAHLLGVHKSWLYRKIARLKLWPTIKQLRLDIHRQRLQDKRLRSARLRPRR